MSTAADRAWNTFFKRLCQNACLSCEKQMIFLTILCRLFLSILLEFHKFILLLPERIQFLIIIIQTFRYII